MDSFSEVEDLISGADLFNDEIMDAVKAKYGYTAMVQYNMDELVYEIYADKDGDLLATFHDVDELIDAIA